MEKHQVNETRGNRNKLGGGEGTLTEQKTTAQEELQLKEKRPAPRPLAKTFFTVYCK